MAMPDREAIDTFMSVTGASEGVAVRELREHLCNLNEAVNSYFNDANRNIPDVASAVFPENDLMDIDDPGFDEEQRYRSSHPSLAGNLNSFSILDPNYSRCLLDQNLDFTKHSSFAAHPRDLKVIPVEDKVGNEPSSQYGCSPTAEDKSVIAEVPEAVIIDDDDSATAQAAHGTLLNGRNNGSFHGGTHRAHPRPSAPDFEDIKPSAPELEVIRPGLPIFDDFHDDGNDVEAVMMQAAIEASKREVERDFRGSETGIYSELSVGISSQRQIPLEDAEFAHAVSLSLKMAEQEKARREQGVRDGPSDLDALDSAELKALGKSVASNGRLESGSSSIQDEAQYDQEQALAGHNLKRMSSTSKDSAKDIGKAGPFEARTPPNPVQEDTDSEVNGNVFPSDEWGGITLEEHDEAVMLEAAMFGGAPVGSEYGFPHAPHQFMHRSLDSNGCYYACHPRPPSPSLEAQRLIREQQDDEYLLSLQADQEKELKAKVDAEARHLEEQAAREAAFEEERLKEELERVLAAKEASLPREPASDDENAVTLLVRMPDGGRSGRRFLKSDMLQFLFDFIDVGRGVKPDTYRLVRPYPRRAFSKGESGSTFSDLGLSGKQEALFLESI